jgi:hypothetical protein
MTRNAQRKLFGIQSIITGLCSQRPLTRYSASAYVLASKHLGPIWSLRRFSLSSPNVVLFIDRQSRTTRYALQGTSRCRPLMVRLGIKCNKSVTSRLPREPITRSCSHGTINVTDLPYRFFDCPQSNKKPYAHTV